MGLLAFVYWYISLLGSFGGYASNMDDADIINEWSFKIKKMSLKKFQ
jgi:hypothetical protein